MIYIVWFKFVLVIFSYLAITFNCCTNLFRARCNGKCRLGTNTILKSLPSNASSTTHIFVTAVCTAANQTYKRTVHEFFLLLYATTIIRKKMHTYLIIIIYKITLKIQCFELKNPSSQIVNNKNFKSYLNT